MYASARRAGLVLNDRLTRGTAARSVTQLKDAAVRTPQIVSNVLTTQSAREILVEGASVFQTGRVMRVSSMEALVLHNVEEVGVIVLQLKTVFRAT
jgi:hypothetical protein